MKRLPGILLLTFAALVVVIALLVSGLRLALPHLNNWREPILAKIEQVSGIPVEVSEIHASWQTFGPTLDIRDINVLLKDKGTLTIKRVTLALDIWQSLLHARWQFRDLTFYQLNAVTNTALSHNGETTDFEVSKLNDLFLRQFDHFDLRDSNISFLTLSGQRANLHIPHLTWLNGNKRHRAEGKISLSSFNGQHGLVNVRMDLRDQNGTLNSGKIWMQADDVDVKPWFGEWMRDNIKLNRARFSMAAWVNIKDGGLESADIWLQQGGAEWSGEKFRHELSVQSLLTHISKLGTGWQVQFPLSGLKLDNQSWSQGSMVLAWLPGNTKETAESAFSEGELRIRANQLTPDYLAPLLPLAETFAPKFVDVWRTLHPAGNIDSLALDIPLEKPETLRMKVQWHNLSWNQWKLLPGAQHVAGNIVGSLQNGRLNLNIHDARLPYEHVFRAPLEIAQGNATLRWQDDAQGLRIDGSNINVQANGVQAHGDFSYQHPEGDQPWLKILAGITATDGGQAWRYFPENLMGKSLVDYLSGAIKAGKAQNATLVYSGNPHFFPYLHNEGQFQVFVPLKDATFAFQPDWPALQHLDIDLDFRNDGLWMKAPKAILGGVTASNLDAVIPDYAKEKLFIDADINGAGESVGPYFKQTPLADTLGATLDELKLKGDVSARLHLAIPLDGEMTTAQGNVSLRNNTLSVVPLNSTLHHLTGEFSFKNGNLTSGPLQATWFNQPLTVDFTTQEQEKAYQVDINLNGNWQAASTGVLPDALSQSLKGSFGWKGNVGVTLPYRGDTTWQVDLTGDLKNVSSHLPVPAAKPAGESLPLVIKTKGDMHSFSLTGSLGQTTHFNSHWLLNKKLTLERAIWVSDSRSIPPLPENQMVELNLPPLDGAQWLAVLQAGTAEKVSHSVSFPDAVTLRTPSFQFAGQAWNNLNLVMHNATDSTVVDITGREINGKLTRRENTPWDVSLNYLYYNPVLSALKVDKTAENMLATTGNTIDFSQWPDLNIHCAECWLMGQKYGRINADLAIQGNTLTLTQGLIDTGFARLTASGEWVNQPGSERTSLKGVLSGKSLDEATGFFGVGTPLQGASFKTEYDLHWRNIPWRPDVASLNGIIKTKLGKGKIAELETGHAGQLLRLVSFDALLRKLRFDFSDTFGSGFYFDSIRSTAWIKDGTLHTDDTLVDGLEADIAMKGTVDLVNRQLNMEAAVAPEISATVGVATAFAVNPIVGAAVFAASKVLGPLWSKIALLRYQITGPIDKPRINEVLRQPRKTATQ